MVESHLSAAEVQARLGNRIATPLMATLRRAADTPAEDIGLRERCFQDTFEAALKYVATLLIAQHRVDGLRDTTLLEHVAKLARPSLGTYAAIVRDATHVYKHSELPHLRELTAFLGDDLEDKVFQRLQTLSDMVDYPTPSNARSYKQLVDVLVVARNRAAHGAAATRARLQMRCALMEAVTMAMYERLRPVFEMRLILPQAVQDTPDGAVLLARSLNGSASSNVQIECTKPQSTGHVWVRISKEEEDERWLDLFPFCHAEATESETEIRFGFLNRVVKSRIDYLSYTDNRFILPREDPLFSDAQTHLMEVAAEEGSIGLPDHLMKLLEVSAHAKHWFEQSLVHKVEGNLNTAISNLRQSVQESPGFRAAVYELASLLTDTHQYEEAHEALEAYLNLLPDDEEMLLLDAEVLLRQGRSDSVSDRMERVLAADPTNTWALDLRERAQTSRVDLVPDSELVNDRMLLPHEFLLECFRHQAADGWLTWLSRKDTSGEARGVGLPGRRARATEAPEAARIGRAARYLAIAGIVGLSLLTSALFRYGKEPDWIMAAATLALGVVWGLILYSTHRIRRLLIQSRPNFAAFIRSQIDVSPDRQFLNLVTPIFGTFPGEGSGWKRFTLMLWYNRLRIVLTLIVSIGLTYWFFDVTRTTTVYWYCKVAYVSMIALLWIGFVYLLSLLVCFHSLLRKLRFQDIHFSLVQHPKLSIRYLSLLSRRLSYPMIIVYVAFVFALYLGPFEANLAFVAVQLLLLLFTCYVYYSTIFLVRSVIIQNKWRRIAEFSVHFDKPFNRLIEKADRGDLDRLMDLTAMRDFLDGMEVWADKKRTLLVTSIFYLTVIVASTSGLSYLMTRAIMPTISCKANQIVSDGKPRFSDETFSGGEVIRVRVQDVDDTFIVYNSSSLDELLQEENYSVGIDGGKRKTEDKNTFRVDDSYDEPKDGFMRCDWQFAGHGELDHEYRLPSREDANNPSPLFLLLVAYNKVFHGIPGMGGGKLSYAVDVSGECTGKEKTIFSSSRFIRMNTPQLVFCAVLEFRWVDGKLKMIERVGKEAMVPFPNSGPGIQEQKAKWEKVKNHINWLGKQLCTEDQATWQGEWKRPRPPKNGGRPEDQQESG